MVFTSCILGTPVKPAIPTLASRYSYAAQHAVMVLTAHGTRQASL
jgi:hypothetical protein